MISEVLVNNEESRLNYQEEKMFIFRQLVEFH